MSEVEWWRLRAAEINALAAKGAVAIVPIGSTEQHGPHLPVQVDSLLVGEIARRAAREAEAATAVVVTPTVWTGLAEHHMGLGGTLTLDFGTFLALLRCVCSSLMRQNFRWILLLNGHGGNITALNVVVNELTAELGIPLATATYWLLASDAFARILEHQKNVRHACEAETSMMLALAPSLVDMNRATEAVGPTNRELMDTGANDAAYRWRSFKARTSHGAIGDPRSASPEKGEQLLSAAAQAVAALITNSEFWTLPS